MNCERFYRTAFFRMGTIWEIKAYASTQRCEPALKEALAEVDRLDRLLSVYREDSELSRINRSAKRTLLNLDTEVLWVISEAVRYASFSGGAFDPTSGPLIRLWGFGSEGSKDTPPEPYKIRETRKRVGFQNLRTDGADSRLQRLIDDVEIDLGGIGKGYAVDRVVRLLRDYGIERALVNCGSTAHAIGSPPGQEGWRIGIQHPRRPGKLVGTIRIRDKAISTSGDYERFFTYRGKRFSHILDPRTGYPVIGMASVTVVAPSALAADGLSTAVFVLGAAPGKKLLERLPGVEAFIVPEEARPGLSYHATGGWPKENDPFLSKVCGRRAFLGLLVGATLMFLFRSPAIATVYLTEEAALNRLMPEAEEFKPDTVQLSPDQLARAQVLAGKRFRDDRYRFHIGLKGGRPIGFAVALDVIGKEQPISFLAGVDPSGKLKGLEVLIYRESRGSEIRSARFMRQFVGASVTAPLQLGQDVQAVSGATLSSRAAAFAVKKALALVEVVFGNEGRQIQ